MLEKVRRMIYTDHDSQVLANCLTVIMQVSRFPCHCRLSLLLCIACPLMARGCPLQVEGPKKLADKVLVYSLLNRLKVREEWRQVNIYILSLC